MGNLIPVRKTYRTLGFAGQKATSNREGGQRTYFSWVSWCKSRLLLIAPRIRRKRISYIISYFLLFLLPFVLAASIFSLRYALLRRSSKGLREEIGSHVSSRFHGKNVDWMRSFSISYSTSLHIRCLHMILSEFI